MAKKPSWPLDQSVFLVVSPEDLPRTNFAKTIASIVQPLFSPVNFPTQETMSAVWPLENIIKQATCLKALWKSSQLSPLNLF